MQLKGQHREDIPEFKLEGSFGGEAPSRTQIQWQRVPIIAY